MKKYYSKNKCECIRGQEIIGMGKSTDEHLRCHKCGFSLFPWERRNEKCGCLQEEMRGSLNVKADKQ